MALSETEAQRLLMTIEGYAELGLIDLAWDEWQALPAATRVETPFVEIELSLLMHEHRWPDAVDCAKRLRAKDGHSRLASIHGAYALHEIGLTSEAHTWLTAGPSQLINDPLYHYNMACYLTVLGDLAVARLGLDRAFKIDPSLREFAKKDADLAPFHATL
jgi:predicted Zn-dependent protease